MILLLCLLFGFVGFMAGYVLACSEDDPDSFA
jgi:hypothetical protein